MIHYLYLKMKLLVIYNWGMKRELSKYIIASLKIVTIKCVYLLLLQEKMCEDIYQKNKNCQGPTDDQHRDF